MMNAMATAEVIDAPVTSLVEMEAAVEELVILQRKAAEIERRAKVLRAQVKDGLAACGLRKFTTGLGHTALIILSTSWRGEKSVADALVKAGRLDPLDAADLFRATSNVTLRIAGK